MRKILLTILIFICYFSSNAQSPLRINKYLIDSLAGSGYWYIYHDSTHTGQWGLVGGSGGGGGGSGTVTSITQAYGIINTPNPITTTGTVKLDSATVFPQLRATIKQHFGIPGEDVNLGLDRHVNGDNASWSMFFDELYEFNINSGFGSYVSATVGDGSPIFEANMERNSYSGVAHVEATTTSSLSSLTANGATGNQYVSVNSISGVQEAQIGNHDNVSGRWIDARFNQTSSSTLTSVSNVTSWLEQWTGSADQRFTNVRETYDSTGWRAQTYRKAGANDDALYKGIRVDTSSNLIFENYPSTREDGGAPQKVFYSSDATGRVRYGVLDTTFYATNARLKKVIDSLPTGGGSPGGSNGQIQYNNSSSFGGAAALVYATSGTHLSITAQASTDVPLNIKGASSQSANYLNISTSAGTGDLLRVTSSGEMIFANNSDAGDFDMQLDKGLYVANVGTNEAGLVIDDDEDAANYFQVYATTNIWGIVAGGRALQLSSGFGSGQPVIIAPGVTTTAVTFSQQASMMALRFEYSQGADVASAAGAITLGVDGNVFEITGTNAITLISNVNWQNGSEIILVFTSTASLVDGTANSGTNIGFELAGNANFNASADDVITLVLSELGGTQRWREKARSVN